MGRPPSRRPPRSPGCPALSIACVRTGVGRSRVYRLVLDLRVGDSFHLDLSSKEDHPSAVAHRLFGEGGVAFLSGPAQMGQEPIPFQLLVFVTFYCNTAVWSPALANSEASQ